MDPKGNLAEQLELAREINAINDAASDDGELTEEQELDIVHAASRLAELVIALDEWMRKGGFSPWQK